MSQAGRRKPAPRLRSALGGAAACGGFQDGKAPRDHKVTFCLQNYVTVVMNLELNSGLFGYNMYDVILWPVVVFPIFKGAIIFLSLNY